MRLFVLMHLRSWPHEVQVPLKRSVKSIAGLAQLLGELGARIDSILELLVVVIGLVRLLFTEEGR